MTPIGPLHRDQRKLIAQTLQPRIIQRDFAPIQERLNRRLVKKLLDDPENLLAHILR